MHLDEERIERMRDAEGPADGLAADRRHVLACAQCAALLERATADAEDVRRWLGALDPPVAEADVVEETLRATLARAAPARRRRIPALAAAAVLVVVAGAAFAVPGSPLRAWVIALVSGPLRAGRSSEPAPGTAPPETVAEAPRSGVAIAPGPSVVVRFTTTQAAGSIAVRLVDDPEVLVEGPAGAARYASGAGRIVVDNAGSTASFEVLVPRSAPKVEIRVAGRRLFLKDGDRVTAVAGAGGAYILPLAP